MLDFTAIDFETANSFRGSPCSVGLVKVRDGKIVREQHWLVRPPETVGSFDSWNISIHGITAEMVKDAPRWKEILPQILEFVGKDILVAHNAAFDMSVIRQACATDGIESPEFSFLCTLVASRKALELPSYRLPFVLESMGFAIENHHDALDDARAVVQIVGELAVRHGAADLPTLAQGIGLSIGQMTSDSYRGSTVKRASTSSPYAPVETNIDADADGYLYGKVVVFTGALGSMTRESARLKCAQVGGIPEANTTKRTNVLVVGDIDPSTLRVGSELTAKARKAFALQSKGQEIEVMTEDEFLRCI